MELTVAISERRSIRKFKKKPVEDEILNKIIECGIWAPSAGNIQSWEAIIVKDSETKSKLAFAAYMRDFIAEAPIILVCCANEHRSSGIYGERGINLYCIQDAACAAQNMLLAIHSFGLGACWIGAFDEDAVKSILKIPEGLRPVSLIPIGYPDEKPYPPIRRSIEEVVHHEKY